MQCTLYSGIASFELKLIQYCSSLFGWLTSFSVDCSPSFAFLGTSRLSFVCHSYIPFLANILPIYEQLSPFLQVGEGGKTIECTTVINLGYFSLYMSV